MLALEETHNSAVHANPRSSFKFSNIFSSVSLGFRIMVKKDLRFLKSFYRL